MVKVNAFLYYEPSREACKMVLIEINLLSLNYLLFLTLGKPTLDKHSFFYDLNHDIVY